MRDRTLDLALVLFVGLIATGIGFRNLVWWQQTVTQQVQIWQRSR
jgi:hypothetical protein